MKTNAKLWLKCGARGKREMEIRQVVVERSKLEDEASKSNRCLSACA